jgi:hypothetical protein
VPFIDQKKLKSDGYNTPFCASLPYMKKAQKTSQGMFPEIQKRALCARKTEKLCTEEAEGSSNPCGESGAPQVHYSTDKASGTENRRH